jgi:hypothetical protein
MAAGSLAHTPREASGTKRIQGFRTRAQTAPPLRGRAVGLERGMRYSSQADLVQVRTWVSGIAGATTDGAGASPPWMTTSSPLLTSEFVRPRLERVTRSRTISLGSGAVDESGAQERSGWSWGARMGAGDPGAPERSGWSWRACMGAGASGSRRPSERAGWSWRVQPPRAHGEGRPCERNGWSWRARTSVRPHGNARRSERNGWSWQPGAR